MRAVQIVELSGPDLRSSHSASALGFSAPYSVC